ncbi:MAG TPA: biotin/lipoyl-binding protein, partial [Longimicrobiaceae bacterium]|nr:biotin/lipoyl-binding protein [Longimicrobiaceae bacterium]
MIRILGTRRTGMHGNEKETAGRRQGRPAAQHETVPHGGATHQTAPAGGEMNAPSIRQKHLAGQAATVAALAIAAVAACAPAAPPPPPPPQVTVAAAVGRPITEWDEFTGRFEATNTVEVRPRVSGFVRSVGFTEGALVSRGQVLFEIDPRPYQDEVARAAAALQQARTRLRLAASETERAQRLVAAQAI